MQLNTACFESVGCGINHIEGGWPKDINPQDTEQTIRFRKKVEKDESYISSVLRLYSVRFPVWLQSGFCSVSHINETSETSRSPQSFRLTCALLLDASSRWNTTPVRTTPSTSTRTTLRMRRKQKELRRHHLQRPSTCSGRKASRPSRLSASCSAPDWTLRSFLRDPNDGKRTITCLSWHPDDNQKLAAAYSCLEFQKASRLTCLDSYIWDIGEWIRQIALTPAHARLAPVLENPNRPETTLKPASALVCLDYNPKDSHTLLGGCYNGQISGFPSRRLAAFARFF